MRLFRRALVATAFLGFALPVAEAQQPRRPIAHEDVHLAKRLGGLSLSPDGRRIAFTARREGDEVSQIYLLDLADGGEAGDLPDGDPAGAAGEGGLDPAQRTGLRAGSGGSPGVVS